MPGPEVTNVSPHGFRLLWNGAEYFLAFESWPRFPEASVGAIGHVELQGEDHFYWPGLDVDLSLEIIKNPDNYPLASKD